MSSATRRSGVSPLIAAVLLIALTMGLAAIITPYVTTFAEERSQQLKNRSGQEIQCSYAGVDVADAVYISANNQTDVSVENTGTVDFNNVSVVTYTGSAVQGRTYVSPLAAGEAESVTISGTDSKPDRVRAISKQCPAVSSDETSIGTS
ncbi:MAG: CARDB domain-containing protein [Candidatus Nanohaloarchaea archaeon]|nr:CARDB domain-containing protein [Candidatus Nanohaloarchaea archaeon]